MVRIGRSKLHFPDSKHNKERDGKPCALAMDLFERNADGVAVWRMSFFKTVYNVLVANGFSITWGGNWAKFKDGPHFEIDEGA